MNETPGGEEKLTTLPPQNWTDPDGDGILADMARVFDAKPNEPAKEATKEPAKQATTAPKGKDDGESVKDDQPLVDEDFFGDDKTEETKSEEKPKEEATSDDFDKETEELAKGMETKAFDKFKSLRAELKEAKAKTVTPEVQARLDELELKAKEADGLKERLETLSNVSAKVRMEQSPEYRAEVLEPAADVFETVDKLSELYEIDPSVIRSILRIGDRKQQNALIDEHLKDFSDFDRSEVYRSIQDFNALSKHRERMLANAESKLTELDARRAEAEIKARDAERTNMQTIQKAIWEKYQSIIPGLLDEDDEPTPDMKRLMARGFAVDFGKAKAKDQAFAAFSGVLLPHLVGQVKALQDKLAEYEKEDKKQTKRLAKVGETVAAGDAKASESSDDFMKEFLSKKF